MAYQWLANKMASDVGECGGAGWRDYRKYTASMTMKVISRRAAWHHHHHHQL